MPGPSWCTLLPLAFLVSSCAFRPVGASPDTVMPSLSDASSESPPPEAPTTPSDPIACVYTEPRGEATSCAPLSHWLARVKKALRPICEPNCGIVELLADDTLDRPAAMKPSVPALASWILYHPERVEAAYGVWFWILAHEMGHHIDMTMRPDEPKSHAWERELRADALAGCALVRAGLPLNPTTWRLRQAEPGPGSLADFWAELSGSDGEHPHWRFHIAAIDRGYELCSDRVPGLSTVLSSIRPVLQAAYAASDEAREQVYGIPFSVNPR